MKVFEGNSELEETDDCVVRQCWKRELCCGLRMWLKEHKATIWLPIKKCKETEE